MTTSSLYGILSIVSFATIWVFAVIAFFFTRRILRHSHVTEPLPIGVVSAILRKVRTREPMSDEERILARQVLADRGSALALAIPATLFCIGCFFVFGSLEQLHGRTPSERTFLGVFPMLTSTNIALQMLKSAKLKRRLPARPPEPAD